MSQKQATALPQLGTLWRTQQLNELGLSSRAIGALVRQGDLLRVRQGCYIRRAAWDKQPDDIRGKQLIHAHAHGTLTTSNGGYVYSHTSAARLHGLFLWNVDQTIHVALPSNPSSERLGKDVRGHKLRLTPSQITTVEYLKVTDLERTTVDCARTLNYRQALIIMDHALRLGADKHLMHAHANSLSGRRGVRTLQRCLANADPLSESPGETLTRELLARLKLPMPAAQVEVQSRIGRHRMDFAWKKEKVALEFDGEVKYFRYERTDRVIFEERRREKALVEDGWSFIRVEWRDLFQEQEFKARVLKALRR
ncbi:very-short-patch-repair endonuclease/cell division inhibitor SulA [Paenarthrobacter nicotinovorans]|uniref:type IV toxin-antitoxin system AbiEi family antitoxin domain-containing protein n=1 Tax=Micrococcaceae TaxID=1268 RepID=UPI0008764AA9|nr:MULTISPECIES: type IV toxin-antitoxin system AbiEi family antitoxin domain-containing protein [Micrococcaceae]MDR6438016.1 very-short-patch-repair endonuclease/cell division inhibitor SulA [Paenarthrobacter nicotinovorans]SCZ62457.1 Transcriptional regulator, AbiEi antitoxin, Type IV TA system [Arthrobacter sp. UNCCL28]